MELTLARGVTRWQVVLEGTAALLVRLAVLSTVGAATVWALDGPAGLGLDPAGIVAVSIALFLLTAVVGGAALCAGAITGRPGAAAGVGAAAAVVAYALDAVAELADVPWLGGLSPYRWAFGGDPLVNGPDAAGLATLGAVLAATAIVGGLGFAQRDLRSA